MIKAKKPTGIPVTEDILLAMPDTVHAIKNAAANGKITDAKLLSAKVTPATAIHTQKIFAARSCHSVLPFSFPFMLSPLFAIVWRRWRDYENVRFDKFFSSETFLKESFRHLQRTCKK
jgi:hypothetical protein